MDQVDAGWIFADPTVEASDILLRHEQRRLERMAAEELVLAVQDTCFLSPPALSGHSLRR